MVLNNYWFLLCRTLMNERVWWIILPILAYGSIAAGMFVPDNSPLFDWSVDLGEGFILGHLLTFTGVFAAIVVLWFINRGLMIKLIYNEINKVEDTKVKHVSEYKFLDRYGEIGEYMRLELKCYCAIKSANGPAHSIPGSDFIYLHSELYRSIRRARYEKLYPGLQLCDFRHSFLSSLMSYEGNYIDGLMSRKESIYTLLRAKYILYSIAILIPLFLMIPAMATGKLAVLSCIGWAVFVAGCVYFCLFQLAVYNNRTVDLNAKMTNRQNMGTGLQNLISGAAFGVPLLMNFMLTTFSVPQLQPGY